MSAAERDRSRTAGTVAGAGGAPRALRLLLVEDSANDALLLIRALRRGGYEPTWRRVEDAAAMEAALAGEWDAVIADYQLPSFSAPAALALLQRRGLDLPFIIVSGHVGEDAAVAAMKTGAHDYLRKDNLTRLAAAVERELREAEVRHARRRAEMRTATLLDITRAITGTLDIDAILDRVQRRTVEVLPCDGVAMLYRDAAEGALRLRSHYGLPDALLPLASTLTVPADAPCPGSRTAFGSLVLNDVRDLPGLPAGPTPVRALIAAPLQAHGRQLGVLVAFAFHADTFDPAQIELSEAIASELAIALEAAELYRAQQEEARVSGALALVGQELIAALDTPRLLDRLCQLTTQHVECTFATVALRREADPAYVATACHGLPAEDWETLQALQIPPAMLGGLLKRLEQTPVVTADIILVPRGRVAALLSALGITHVLLAALRRGHEVIGLMAGGCRHRSDPFAPWQLRVFGGIAQLAALGLETARLVEELARASALKSDFLATMSHELRTPLNIIIGYSDLLLEDAFGSLTAEQRETLERCDKHARELLELITATLDISRLETGRMPIDVRECDLTELVGQVRAETHELHVRAGLQFEWRVAPGLRAVHTDPVKLKVVLKNLVSNAAKFTEHGTVCVDLHALRGGVELSVADTGIGIQPEHLRIIFEPFRQADSSSTRRYGGVGLGLYITRRLVEALGGTIGVDSTPGRGSTFRVWIPDPGAGCHR